MNVGGIIIMMMNACMQLEKDKEGLSQKHDGHVYSINEKGFKSMSVLIFHTV